MKNKKLTFLAFISLAVVAAAGSVSSAISWFTLQARISGGNILKGSSYGAYFGGGDGSSTTPYKILTRTHMYNLAWLQYLGMFNEKTTGTNTLKKQFYFTVMNDIDMGGMAIPPIGTEEYPFLGNFDGGEYVISNFTVANFSGTNGIQRKPTTVTNAQLENIEIVGFFGVVGDIDGNYTYSSSTNSIHDFAIDNFTVKTASDHALIGLAAGYVDGVVDSVAIGESAFDIADSTAAISTGTGQNVSYPYGNVLSNYGVVGYCTQDKLDSSKIVDIKADQPQFFEVGSGDTGNNWGASIPMKEIYDKINTYRSQATRVQYKSAEYYYYDQNHNEITTLYNAEYTNSPCEWNNLSGNSATYYQYRDTQLLNSSGQEYASYSLGYRVTGQNSDTIQSEQFTYLYGHMEGTIANGNTIHRNEFTNVTAYLISDGGTNYLSQNTNTPTAVTRTDSSSATKWALDGNYLYTQIIGGTNGSEVTTYYLTYNGSLRLTTTKTTEWTFRDDAFFCTYSNNTYYLRYNNGWTCTTTSPWTTSNTGKYFISYTTGGVTHYITANGTTGITDATTQENATAWSATTGNTTYYYITSGNSNYYIKYSSNSLGLTTSTGNNSGRMYKNGNYLYNGSRYIRYNNGWTTTTSTYNRTSLTFTQETTVTGHNYSVTRSSTTANYRVDNTSTENATYETADTYIPLKYETNDNDDPIDVSEENTGYIVSGANYDNIGNQSTAGDIRVSKYATTNLSSSFANGTTSQRTYSKTTSKYFEVITRTANSGGYKRIKDSYNSSVADNATFPTAIRNYTRVAEADFGFEKYSAARTAFHKSFVGENENSSSGDIYGLHFMDATINLNHKISVSRAAVQGATYQYDSTNDYTLKTWQENQVDSNGMVMYDNENKPIKIDKSAYVNGKYELLEDCVDFKLNKNGTINFFSGTYFTNNNAFFSLNHVFRNTATVQRTINGETVEVSKENEITDVKQISEVWTNTDYNVNDNNPKPRYLYKYSDNKWLQNDGTVSSSTSKPSNAGEKVFDLGWVMGTSTDFEIKTNCVYYFEIPVVTGEYALGAVSGKLGAYLMYLDIGASDITNEKMRVKEKITTKTEYYQYPKGVGFAEIIYTDNDPAFVDVDGSEAGTVIIPTSVSGTISLELDDDKLKCGPPTGGGSLTQTTYHNEDVSVVTGANYGTELTLVSSSWKQVVKEKVSTYVYDAANQKMHVTYTSDISTTTNTNSTAVVIHDNKLEDPEGYTLTEADYTNSKFVAYIPTDQDIYVEYSYQAPYAENNGNETENVTLTYEVKYDVSTDTYTYEFTFETTVAIKVKVVDLKNKSTYKIKVNGTEYVKGNTVTINP